VIQVAGTSISVNPSPNRLPQPRITEPAAEAVLAGSEGAEAAPELQESPTRVEFKSQEWPSYSTRLDAGNRDIPAFLRRRMQVAQPADAAHS
jgi:hypothetical protein